MFSPQLKGKIFENNIHNFLSKTRHEVLMNETQIRAIDNTITAIDHLLVSNNVYYCFQDKRLKTNISISDFNHFIKCVEKVSEKNNHSYKVYAIYLSFTEFSSVANKQLYEENEKHNKGNSNIEYIKVVNNSTNDIIKYLQQFLYENSVYSYSADGDCIML
jgi:hypothetical protein